MITSCDVRDDQERTTTTIAFLRLVSRKIIFRCSSLLLMKKQTQKPNQAPIELLVVIILLYNCQHHSSQLSFGFRLSFLLLFTIQNMTCTNFYFAFVFINPTRQYLGNPFLLPLPSFLGGLGLPFKIDRLHTVSLEEDEDVLLICDSHRTRLLFSPSFRNTQQSA